MQQAELERLVRQVLSRYEDISIGNTCVLASAIILQDAPGSETTPEKILDCALQLYCEMQSKQMIPLETQP